MLGHGRSPAGSGCGHPESTQRRGSVPSGLQVPQRRLLRAPIHHPPLLLVALPQIQVAGDLVTPFKSILGNLILTSRLALESVSIGVDKSLGGISYDLLLTDVAFVKDWLPRTCADLRSLSIWDFWIQSCWRRSDVLALISSCCNGLVELEVKNAWLSVDGLNLMPTLTSLTLEFIRLDD